MAGHASLTNASLIRRRRSAVISVHVSRIRPVPADALADEPFSTGMSR